MPETLSLMRQKSTLTMRKMKMLGKMILMMNWTPTKLTRLVRLLLISKPD